MSETPVTRTYDRVAPRYDKAFRAYLEPCYRWALEHLALEPGQRLLDVGCGTCELESRLCVTHGSTVELVGVEPSAGMLEVGRQKLKAGGCDATLHHGFLADIDPDVLGTFDWVVTLNILHFVTDTNGAVRDWARPLNPGGRLLLITLDGDLPHLRWISPIMARMLPGFTRAHRTSEVREALESAGLVVERLERRRIAGVAGAILAIGNVKSRPA